MIQSMGAIHRTSTSPAPAPDAPPHGSSPSSRTAWSRAPRRSSRSSAAATATTPTGATRSSSRRTRSARPTATRARCASTTRRCSYLAYVQGRAANGLVRGARRLDRRRHVDARRGHRHLRVLQIGEGDGADGGRARPHRRRGGLHGARRQHRGRVQRALLQPGDAQLHDRRPGRHHRLAGAGRAAAGDGHRPAAETKHVLDDLVARIHAYHPNGGGPHISGGMVSLQAIYRVADGPRPRRLAVGRLPGAERAELRQLRQAGADDDPRVLGLGGPRRTT